jgi:hypothetical protein
MKERSILHRDIKDAIQFPTARLSSFPPTKIIQKVIKGKTLEIVYEPKGQIIIIITAYYL